MDRKEAIREKILGLGVDVCGFGGIERFEEAPSLLINAKVSFSGETPKKHYII